MEHSNNPTESFLREAGQWIDFFGRAYPIKKGPKSFLRIQDINVRHLATDSRHRLDFVKNLALYIGRLWLCDPMIFAGQPSALVAPPAKLPDHERGSVKYDKAVLEILINRCARLPRQEDTSLAADYGCPGWDYDPLDYYYAQANTDENLIEGINVYYWALQHETNPEEIAGILNILLGDAWELYLRANS
jgi:hypothetical protein|nr:MAG TPA: hypothetical protein [Caudoviricetes sp.]